jgi:hypothetical protein
MPSTVVCPIEERCSIWRKYLMLLIVDKAVEYILAQPDGKF